MESTIEQVLQQAVAAHKEGKLQQAESLYRSILEVQPLHPDANHNLGVLATSDNRTGVALPLFRTALKANRKIPQFWLSYIDGLIKEKRYELAKSVIEKAKMQGLSGQSFDVMEAMLPTSHQKGDSVRKTPSKQQLDRRQQGWQRVLEQTLQTKD